jgi:hypothetical protein
MGNYPPVDDLPISLPRNHFPWQTVTVRLPEGPARSPVSISPQESHDSHTFRMFLKPPSSPSISIHLGYISEIASRQYIYIGYTCDMSISVLILYLIIYIYYICIDTLHTHGLYITTVSTDPVFPRRPLRIPNVVPAKDSLRETCIWTPQVQRYLGYQLGT